MKEIIIYCIAAIIIFSFAGTMAYKTWFLGETEKDYDIVCIGGHQYYRANFANKGFLGVRLNSDGTPVKCETNN